MQKIIDPHVHFFDIEQGDYQWLKNENPPFWPDKHIIQRNFSCADVMLSGSLNLCGVVHIEAGFDNDVPTNEIEFLKQSVDIPYKAVAFVDICQGPVEFSKAVAKLKKSTSVVGIRHILDEHALSILSSPNVTKNLATLATSNLLFDCQMPLNNQCAVSALIQLLKEIPSLRVIINHCGFPPSTEQQEQLSLWKSAIQSLAQFSHVAIKCSGWEMKSRHYSNSWVSQIVKYCIEVFGENRVMIASNFPLCLLSKEYNQYWQDVIENTPKQFINKICYENAKFWYNVE